MLQKKPTLYKGWISVFLLTLSNISAESTTGDQGAGNDDITNFLRTLIFPTLLEKHAILKVLIYCRDIDRTKFVWIGRWYAMLSINMNIVDFTI